VFSVRRRLGTTPAVVCPNELLLETDLENILDAKLSWDNWISGSLSWHLVGANLVHGILVLELELFRLEDIKDTYERELGHIAVKSCCYNKI